MNDKFMTYLAELLHLMVQSYWGALFFLFAGVLLLRYSIKKPTSIFNLRGWVGGIALIAGGLLIIIFKLIGKI